MRCASSLRVSLSYWPSSWMADDVGGASANGDGALAGPCRSRSGQAVPQVTQVTALAIILATALAGSVVGLVLLTRWALNAKNETLVAHKLYQDQRQIADEVTAERNDWHAKASTAQYELAKAKIRIGLVEGQRNAATQGAIDATVRTIRESGASTGAGLVNGLLSEAWPMPEARGASAEDGDRGTAGVPSASIAGAAAERGGIPER